VNEVVTVGRAFREAERSLTAAGVASARLDARILLGRALGIGQEVIVADPDRPIDPSARRAFGRLLARRVAREPISHILGVREFWGLDFDVTADTLDPRPDSETLVEAVLARVGTADRPLRLLDFGTGTGCLLLALLSELPAAQGLGVDRSAAALSVARQNASRHSLSHRAIFVAGRWGDSLAGEFDVVVTNPPYIPTSEFATLSPEVNRFEPRLALDGGSDGLECFRELAPDLARMVAPDGFAVVEFGCGQSDCVAQIARRHGLRAREIVRDLAMRPRCAVLTH
jgi:release factor glutamine methyltransferase